MAAVNTLWASIILKKAWWHLIERRSAVRSRKDFVSRSSGSRTSRKEWRPSLGRATSSFSPSPPSLPSVPPTSPSTFCWSGRGRSARTGWWGWRWLATRGPWEAGRSSRGGQSRQTRSRRPEIAGLGKESMSRRWLMACWLFSRRPWWATPRRRRRPSWKSTSPSKGLQLAQRLKTVLQSFQDKSFCHLNSNAGGCERLEMSRKILLRIISFDFRYLCTRSYKHSIGL